ncbi:MAG: GGDEF domain-containing protein [Fervidobacterium sp.]|nr:GGDEF domain-containing protein [Fervidobacterium sp.]
MENIFVESNELRSQIERQYKNILAQIKHLVQTLNEVDFVNRLAKIIYTSTSVIGVRIMTPSYVKIVGRPKGISYNFYSQNMILVIYYFSLPEKEKNNIETIFEIAEVHLNNIVEHNNFVKSTFFDKLTGAYTRQAGLEIIGKIFESIKRGQKKGYLVFIDVDDLKKYNDKYGHQKGDELLLNLSKTVLSNIRKNDIFIRYGGDEFLLYIDSTQPDSVVKRIVEISSVKFSYGIVNLEECSSIDDAIQKADMKMYEFKNTNKKLISQYAIAEQYTLD